MDLIRAALIATLALLVLDGAAYARLTAVNPCDEPSASFECWSTHHTSASAGFWGALVTTLALGAATWDRSRGRDGFLRRALAVVPVVALAPLSLYLLLFFGQPGGSCGPVGAHFAWPPCAHEYWILVPAFGVLAFSAIALASAPRASPRETER